MILLLCTLVALTTYSITPGKVSRFVLEVEKTGIMRGKRHTFTFPKFSGVLKYDPAAPANAAVEFTLDAASMANEDDWVTEADRGKILSWGLDQMIQVKIYPKIQFVSDRIAVSDTARRFRVSGMLTMRGIRRPALIEVGLEENGADILLEGKSVVNMKEWGMKPPSAGLGAVGTNPEMTVRFKLLGKAAK